MSILDYMYMAGDKANHFAWGAISSALVTTFVAALFIMDIIGSYWWMPVSAIIVPLVIGWLKEKYDGLHTANHTADPKDIVFTAMGGLPLAFFLVVTELVTMFLKGM